MKALLPLLCMLLAACAQAPKPAVLAPAAPSAQVAPLQPHPTPGQPWIRVGVKSQRLTLVGADGQDRASYTVSTASRGVGEQNGSLQTPRGWHRVCDKIGDGIAPDTIIYRREVTPWRYTPTLHAEYPDKDWILTRILWLCGLEPGRNAGGEVDSYERAIYIHGAGSHVRWGTPTSRGCVRMKSADVIELFDTVPLGTEVLIDENA